LLIERRSRIFAWGIQAACDLRAAASQLRGVSDWVCQLVMAGSRERTLCSNEMTYGLLPHVPVR
jgi:hypothetical protein